MNDLGDCNGWTMEDTIACTHDFALPSIPYTCSWIDTWKNLVLLLRQGPYIIDMMPPLPPSLSLFRS